MADNKLFYGDNLDALRRYIHRGGGSVARSRPSTVCWAGRCPEEASGWW
jgi:hypothetical protein